MTLSDLALATLWANAELAGDETTVGECVNEALGRANVPLDETEQGITPAASEKLEAWYAAAFRDTATPEEETA